ncbi:putative gag-pol polyprotein, partial [Gregarina niphandrodes]
KQKRVFEENTGHTEPELRQELWTLLEGYRDAWEHPKAAQVRYEAKFEVTGKPHKARVRHYEPEMRRELESQVKRRLELGVIRPPKSDWVAAPHFVKKKTGEWRCAPDYRKLNESMVSDSHPLPRIWDHLRRAAGRKYYVMLDMNSGFWNVPIEKG